MMLNRSGQFIIITAVIILLIIVVLVASVHQAAVATQSPPPIYVAVNSVDQSMQTVLAQNLANYSHMAITMLGGCGSINPYTPTPNQPLGLLLHQELSNLTLIYSMYGLTFGSIQPVYTISWCTGLGGSTEVEAIFTFNLSRLGLIGYRDQVLYSLSAYSTGCALNANNLTCSVTVAEGGVIPLIGLNQSYFYLTQINGWLQANHTVDYDNGTYTVSWILSLIPPTPLFAQIAVENPLGVYVVTSAEAQE